MSRDARISRLIAHTYRELANHRAEALSAGEDDTLKMVDAYPADVPEHARKTIYRHLREAYTRLRTRFETE